MAVVGRLLTLSLCFYFLLLSAMATHDAQQVISPSQTLYLGYGSNLWLHQMALRCPNSTYLGVARLNDYRWIIYSRGYANVVSSRPRNNDVVYGLAYSLTPNDEARLDVNEGVPVAYTKETLEVDFWPSHDMERVNISSTPTKRRMLVYINRNDTAEAPPKSEYIDRMNMGINDAIKLGVPESYIEKHLRPFIPKRDINGVGKLAMQQALEFNDERGA